MPVSVRQAAVDHVFMQAAADLVGRAAQDQPETAADFFVLAARAQPAEAALVEALVPRFDLVLA